MENTPTLFEDLSGLMIDAMSANYKAAATKGMQYYERRRQEGFNEFHHQLLSGTATKEKIEYERMFKITEDQYYALLSASINDEEKQKSHIYANVYRSILNEDISKDNYSKIIRLAKDIPYSALKLLPTIYIYKNYHTKYKSLSKYLNELYEKKIYELKFLDRSDIIHLPSGELQFSDSVVKIKESFFNEIINAFFTKEDLHPDKYHIDLWKEKKALIITKQKLLNSQNVKYVQNVLDDISIPSEPHPDIMSLKKDFSHFIFILDEMDDIKDMENEVEKLNRNNKIIKVKFTFQSNRPRDIFDIKNISDIKRFKEQFSD